MIEFKSTLAYFSLRVALCCFSFLIVHSVFRMIGMSPWDSVIASTCNVILLFCHYSRSKTQNMRTHANSNEWTAYCRVHNVALHCTAFMIYPYYYTILFYTICIPVYVCLRSSKFSSIVPPLMHIAHTVRRNFSPFLLPFYFIFINKRKNDTY